MHKQYLQETRQQGPQQASYNSYYENLFIHYGFPAKLHSDKGVNFENKIIKQLCKIANIRKTRTTPYHLMGNGVVGRFNKSPLSMLGTMTNGQKLNRRNMSLPGLKHIMPYCMKVQGTLCSTLCLVDILYWQRVLFVDYR